MTAVILNRWALGVVPAAQVAALRWSRTLYRVQLDARRRGEAEQRFVYAVDAASPAEAEAAVAAEARQRGFDLYNVHAARWIPLP